MHLRIISHLCPPLSTSLHWHPKKKISKITRQKCEKDREKGGKERSALAGKGIENHGQEWGSECAREALGNESKIWGENEEDEVFMGRWRSLAAGVSHERQSRAGCARASLVIRRNYWLVKRFFSFRDARAASALSLSLASDIPGTFLRIELVRRMNHGSRADSVFAARGTWREVSRSI